MGGNLTICPRHLPALFAARHRAGKRQKCQPGESLNDFKGMWNCMSCCLAQYCPPLNLNGGYRCGKNPTVVEITSKAGRKIQKFQLPSHLKCKTGVNYHLFIMVACMFSGEREQSESHVHTDGFISAANPLRSRWQISNSSSNQTLCLVDGWGVVPGLAVFWWRLACLTDPTGEQRNREGRDILLQMMRNGFISLNRNGEKQIGRKLIPSTPLHLSSFDL